MLEKIRNLAKTWVAGLFIGLLILSFAVWGINDIFRGFVNNDVAKVGDVSIDSTTFEQEFRRRLQALSQQSGQSIDTMQARQFGLDQQILTTLVQTAVLGEATKELGLTISDAALAEAIRSDDAFADVLGEFSRQTYNDLLRLNSLTAAGYESRLRRDMARQQLEESLIAGLQGSQTIANALYEYRGEERDVEYLLISPENAKDIVVPTDDDLAKYHQENENQFTASEYRTFSYVLIEADQFKDQIEVGEDELKNIYEFSSERFVTPEKRTAVIVTFLGEEEANDAYAEVQAGKELLELALARGFTEEQVTWTEVGQSDLLDAKVAEQVFGLEENAVSEPINGDLGWAIAQVSAISPRSAQDFEEARTVILEEERASRAKDKVYDVALGFQDALAGGAGLEEAAVQAGLKANKIGPLDRSGKTQDGQTSEDVANRADILQEVFQGDLGLESDLLDSAEAGFFLFRVEDVIEQRVKPLNEVSSEVMEALKAQRRQEKLAEIAAEVAEKANTGQAFDQLASGFNRSVLKTESPLTRAFTDEVFSSSLVGELFSEAQGVFVYGPANFGESFVVAVSRTVKIPEATDETREIEIYSQLLQQGIQSDILEQYLTHLNESYDVKIYQEVVDRALGLAPDS